MQSGKPSEIVWSSQPFQGVCAEEIGELILGHILDCLIAGISFVCLFRQYSGDRGSILNLFKQRQIVDLSLEFRRTLKIIARILREVVNRVKLGDHYTRRRSRGEVKSHVVMRRRGTLETRMSLRPPSPPRP